MKNIPTKINILFVYSLSVEEKKTDYFHHIDSYIYKVGTGSQYNTIPCVHCVTFVLTLIAMQCNTRIDSDSILAFLELLKIFNWKFSCVAN